MDGSGESVSPCVRACVCARASGAQQAGGGSSSDWLGSRASCEVRRHGNECCFG